MTWGTDRNSNNESGQNLVKKYSSEISVYHKELPVSRIYIYFFLIILLLTHTTVRYLVSFFCFQN